MPNNKEYNKVSVLVVGADPAGLATANVGLVSDIIACPGMDYCALATARSIPVAQELSKRFADPGLARELGRLQIKISGCINACGHHHVGHIGILGLERRGSKTTRSRSAAMRRRPRRSASAPAPASPSKRSAPRSSGYCKPT